MASDPREELITLCGPSYCHVCLNHVRSRLHYELCIVNTPKEEN